MEFPTLPSHMAVPMVPEMLRRLPGCPAPHGPRVRHGTGEVMTSYKHSASLFTNEVAICPL